MSLLAMVMFIPRLVSRLRRRPVMNLPAASCGVSGCGTYLIFEASFGELNPEGLNVDILKQRLDHYEKIFVLDVRTATDFIGEQGHIAGAINIPLEELAAHIDELVDYQEYLIVTICRTDRCSVKAAQLLVQNGFADVHVLKGGMTD